VVVMEKTNARYLACRDFTAGTADPSVPGGASPIGLDESSSSSRLGSPAEFIVVDCSFISLKKILPSAVPLLQRGGRIVALIKPQFEAGKAEADQGRGVITDSAVHLRVVAELQHFVAAQAGLCWRGVIESPLLGPAGNKEFLALIEKIG
jgi:23S rRNA (cytidine1920-2'-O)/16S rRNA (cytidine1409-2'-O)-methyltransferase